jgi:hypothetical protein
LEIIKRNFWLFTIYKTLKQKTLLLVYEPPFLLLTTIF